MRIVLTTLSIGILYGLTAGIASSIHGTFGDVIYWFIMSFGFILIPLFVCVCVFHFLLNIYKWTRRQPALISQILTLCFIFNLFLFSISLPDFIRHQNNAAYIHYKSFTEYFKTEMLEGVITATMFSIAIPSLDNYFKKKIIKFDASRQ